MLNHVTSKSTISHCISYLLKEGLLGPRCIT